MKKAILTTVAIAVASASLSANAGFMFRSELNGVKAQSNQVETPKQEERQYLFEIDYMGYSLPSLPITTPVVTEDITATMIESDFNEFFDSIVENAKLKAKLYENVDKIIVTATDIDTNEKKHSRNYALVPVIFFKRAPLGSFFTDNPSY